jgi:hypothetical protein
MTAPAPQLGDPAVRRRYARALQRSDRRVQRRYLTLAPRDYSEEHLIHMAMDGLLVAEELPTKARERLFAELHTLGWTDRQMAEHTRTTEYTTARILRRLGRDPNVPRDQAVSA